MTIQKMITPYYKQERPKGVRPNYTPEQLTKIKQFIRIVRPFTRKNGFRQVNKHDILMFPGLADREGHRFTASMVAILANQTYGFYVARATIERLLGGNLRRKKVKVVKARLVREDRDRLENLEKLVLRLVAEGVRL